MPEKKYKPIPLFDSIAELKHQTLLQSITLPFSYRDFMSVKEFLLQYDGSEDTFNAYRRDLERLVQWSWFIANKSILTLKRNDIEDFIHFCQKPPKSWIGIKNVPRFITKNAKRVPNPSWRLFVATIKKSQTKYGIKPDKNDYQFSQKALQSLFITISSFYNYLIREDVTDINPIALIRQKSKFIRKTQGARQVRRLSQTQWEYVIKTARELADKNPTKHGRTLFIMSALYLMYLRVSELAVSQRWAPQMGHFYRDSADRWWFKTVGKGNKERHISVTKAMLEALKSYRQNRKLPSDLPTPGESTPLIHKLIGHGGVSSTREIRLIVQNCFDAAIQKLRNDKQKEEESKALEEATVHWLRHTGISDDINKFGRPVSHVRDDAGHSSGATTDLYNDADLTERHISASKKNLGD